MKVNPVSIQAYQQTTRRESSAIPTEKNKLAESQAANVVIEPKKSSVGSGMAVKAPQGTYADSLTPAESQALEMLFGKFRATADRFGNSYQGDSEMSSPEAFVGRMIDVKV